MPEFEWNRLTDVLGLPLLSRLLGISAISIRRYKAAARTPPDEVAHKLHFLSLVVGDLSGAYNEIGIRQWFERKRAQLDGRTPIVPPPSTPWGSSFRRTKRRPGAAEGLLIGLLILQFW